MRHMTVTVIHDSAVSWRKIAQQIRHVLNMYCERGSGCIYVGSLTIARPEFTRCSRIVLYLDVPSLAPTLVKHAYTHVKSRSIVIANSRLVATLLEKYYNIHVDDIVPHGIDSTLIRNMLNSLLDTAKDYDTMYIGNTVREGIDMYIQLVSKLRNMRHLVFTGRRDIARYVPQNVTVDTRYGTLSEAQLCRLYASSRCLVVTSRYEGFCLPVIEAAACGTNVVVPACPPYNEHSIPHKYYYPAEMDIDRPVRHIDGTYPTAVYNIDDVAKVVNVAVRHRPTLQDVAHVLDRYDYVKLYRRIVEYVCKR